MHRAWPGQTTIGLHPRDRAALAANHHRPTRPSGPVQLGARDDSSRDACGWMRCINDDRLVCTAAAANAGLQSVSRSWLQLFPRMRFGGH